MKSTTEEWLFIIFKNNCLLSDTQGTFQDPVDIRLLDTRQEGMLHSRELSPYSHLSKPQALPLEPEELGLALARNTGHQAPCLRRVKKIIRRWSGLSRDQSDLRYTYGWSQYKIDPGWSPLFLSNGMPLGIKPLFTKERGIYVRGIMEWSEELRWITLFKDNNFHFLFTATSWRGGTAI